MAYFLAYEVLYTVVVQLYAGAADGLGIELPHLADNLSACNLSDEEGGTLGSVKGGFRVCATLEAEACVR